jgi:Fe-S cluster biogenesis protein NfuA
VQSAYTDPSEVGQQIEELLAELSGHPDSSVGEAAEELARLLMAMYGAGLQRVVAVLGAGQGPGYRMLSELLDDDLVASLLVLHDLHPEDTTARVGRALESMRPYLGSHAGGVELLGVSFDDPAEPGGAIVRLRLRGSCDGCPSSAVTVKMAIEKAIEEACPEVLRVEVEGMTEISGADAVSTPGRSKPTRELPILQIGMAPPVEPPPVVPVSWVVLDPPPLRPGQCAELDVGGFPVLLALPAGASAPEAAGLVAYRDECPSCHRPLTDAVLRADELTCASCAVAFDVRLAGRALDGSTRHLDPLPLVRRAGGWRLAVPRAPVGASR